MEYFVSKNALKKGNGSRQEPFQTITEAAAIARAGDIVTVGEGIYREYVNPIHKGTKEQPIIYRAKKKGTAVITGAEVVKNWSKQEKDVWMASIPNDWFGDYNPYTVLIKGDWYNEKIKPVHTGEIYLNGKAMYEVATKEEVVHPEKNPGSWDPDGTVYTWWTTQEKDRTLLYANFQGYDPNEENVEINVRRNCFYPDKTGVDYITVSGFVIRQAATQWAPPTAYQDGMIGPHWAKGWIIEECDISNSRCSGITLGKYYRADNENKWTTAYFKDGTQTERDAICQALQDGWTKENIGHHIIRKCNIHDCGQTGIVGHLGGVFSVIEENHIHHINNKQDLAGSEIGGIKMHAAIDVVYRKNHIHHCTRGIWLDWQAQGTRVTQNLFHDNVPPKGTKILSDLSNGEDLFIEVSHGPTLVDHNVFLSNAAMRISANGIALLHNLIAGSFTWVGAGTENSTDKKVSDRYTPYHMPHRTELMGFMTILHGDVRAYNNIFIQQPVREDLVSYMKEIGQEKECQYVCGMIPYDDYPTEEEYRKKFTPDTITDPKYRDMYYEHLPVYTEGNVYFNGAKPWNKEKNYTEDKEHTVSLHLTQEDGRMVLHTDLYKFIPGKNTALLSTDALGEAFEPEQRYENPDGTEIVFDRDFNNCKCGSCPVPGPFEAEKITDKILLEV